MTIDGALERSAHVASRLRVGLGSLIAVEAEASTPAIVQAAIAAAFNAIATLERTMHPSRDGSDLAALATCDPGQQVELHPWTWDVLQLCRTLHICSAGIFDPCLDEASGRMSDLEFLERHWVRVRERVHIDLGGIAKGYAVDRALEALQAAGCTAGMVNAGGDLAVFGGRARLILCRTSEGTGFVPLKDAALASSDAQAIDHPAEHRGYYHGVRRSVLTHGHASVVAPRAVLADALTKCVLLCERAHSQDLLERFGACEVQFAPASPPLRTLLPAPGRSA
jgi:FAD:protein FMN transferase